MYLCPACNHKTFSFAQKWLASSASPAWCSNCDAGSAIQIVDASGYLAGSIVLLTLAGFVAAWLHYPLLFALGFAVSVAWYLWRQHKATLVVVAKAEQRAARRSGWLAFLAVLLPFWFN